MSVAPSSPAVNLREVAAQAWARHQEEVAERKRQEIERARYGFVEAARSALRQVIGYTIADPFSPFTDRELEGAEVTIASTDDLLIDRPSAVIVRIVFAGETFEYRSEGSDPHLLYHVWTCPACGERYIPPTQSDRVNSLAELGAWMDHAAGLHRFACKAVS